MLRNVEAELKAWRDLKSGRGRIPQYLLFTTNANLSPVPAVGGIDRLNNAITEYADDLGLQGWAVWHRDEICRLLDIHSQVRRTYAHFITPGDVLSNLLDYVPDADKETAEMIRSHAGHALFADQWVRLGQAGAQDERQKISLGPVAVDLEAEYRHPSMDEPIRTQAAQYVIEHGETVLRPSHLPADQVPHVVIIGGPGQGKAPWANCSARPTESPYSARKATGS
ncbi:hypothetical protein [Phaeacidiphilus oryzae]|uniref:hypothetical protein n=1 Tax=Phaeacidiphilus oryzae TaxID=348818 RepID=UPI00056A40E6|nr:hypothetical protein [Phaeacidiphilus oryzae]